MKLRRRKGSARPRPMARKTTSMAAADWPITAPSAAPRNGPRQGAPTTAASTPVKKAPAAPWRLARVLPVFWIDVPSSNRPMSQRPMANMMRARMATVGAFWSWKPSVAEPVAARTAMMAPARTAKETSTPPVYQRPWLRSSLAWPLAAAETMPMALIERTGRTQGMRLRMRPPIRAKKASVRRPAALPPAPDLPEPIAASPAVLPKAAPCAAESS